MRFEIAAIVSKLMLSMHSDRKGCSVVIRLHALAFQPMLCPAAGSSACFLVEAGACVDFFQGVLRALACATSLGQGSSANHVGRYAASACGCPLEGDLSLQDGPSIQTKQEFP